MAACARWSFIAAVIEKKKEGKYISIEIYMFITVIMIYLILLLQPYVVFFSEKASKPQVCLSLS